jgi:hypothetical protein
MQIDRSNYEIWIIDWLDGNLNDHQAEELRLFLQNNPDIREELDFLDNIAIKPAENTFLNKDRLRKTTADIPLSQLEYLSVGFLENDLSSEQRDELLEIIEKDPVKKRSFDLVQKTKIIPETHIYKHKNLLTRRSAAQKSLRITVWGLSAAASIGLLIMIYLFIPKQLPDNSTFIVQNIGTDTNLVQMIRETVPEKAPVVKITFPAKNVAKAHLPLVSTITRKVSEMGSLTSVTQDNHTDDLNYEEIQPASVPAFGKMVQKGSILKDNLVSFVPTFKVPAYDDGRSKLSKFIARTVREAFLKEKTPTDAPLKGFEIAEMGVSGLNKLLGWQMALAEKKDENGQLKSVYFSSKILKFNAPVKKSESLPVTF